MNIQNIRAMAEIVNTYALTSLEVSESGTTIKIAKTAEATSAAAHTPPSRTAAASREDEPDGSFMDFNNLTEVKSPIVGVFYSAPSPDADPYVHIESKVKKGDVLCLIEAMKLMNEIVAERDGEIADVCVKNGDIVEFGQPLFKIF